MEAPTRPTAERSGRLDLAAIVLADAASDGARMQGGSIEGARWRATPVARREGRAAAMLAVAALILLATITWALTRDDERGATSTASTSPKSPIRSVVLGPPKPAPEVAPQPLAGLDLASSRVTVLRGDSGALVARVGVVNQGTAPLGAGSGVRAIVLLDGEVIGEQPLNSLRGRGAAAAVDVPMNRCDAGTHTVTVLLEAGTAARDVDMSDNVSTRRMSLVC